MLKTYLYIALFPYGIFNCAVLMKMLISSVTLINLISDANNIETVNLSNDDVS